jgi:hypothetical protein
MEERIIDRENILYDTAQLNALSPIKNKEITPLEACESKNMLSVAKNGLEIVESIKNTDLISESDIENIKKAHGFLLSSYTDVPIYNTRIAKVASILSDGKFPTNDAKFWQCKMQAEVHFNEFIRSVYKLDRVKIDIEEINYQISTINDILNDKNDSQLDKIKLSFDRRRLVNKLSQYVLEMKLLEKDIKQRLREINDWNEISSEFQKNCKFSTSDYDEHTYGTHLYVLKNQLATAKTEEEKRNYKDQLDTFLRMVGKTS